MEAFQRFIANYKSDAASSAKLEQSDLCNSPLRLRNFLLRFSGTSFNHGLYRVVNKDTIVGADAFIGEAFPAFANRIICFGYDWLGRIFAADPLRFESDAAGVTMFEPGIGEALEIPCNLETFHNQELVDHAEEALASSFFAQWAASNRKPELNECISYKIPLYLGGKDVLENLEISNLDVYWTLSGQLLRKTRGLAHGTVIGSVRLENTKGQ